MQKILEIREGRQEQWKPTFTPCNFYFLLQELSCEHSERFPTIFFLGTIENVQPCFTLLKLRILSLIAALSRSQHS